MSEEKDSDGTLNELRKINENLGCAFLIMIVLFLFMFFITLCVQIDTRNLSKHVYVIQRLLELKGGH